MFYGLEEMCILDLSGTDFNKNAGKYKMFDNFGTKALQSDGAYADGIPYIYVKDATAQSWVLSSATSRPSTWSTNNVVIKSQINQG